MIDNESLEDKIREKQKAIRYDLRSYTIEFIVDRFRSADFYVPKYQRGLVWNNSNQSLFIESMIIGLPTSTLFVAQTDDGRIEIIDGGQRVMTLEEYVNGDLRLRGLEDIPELNGTRFHDLTRSQQLKFLNRAIGFIMLSQETSFELRLEIFRRMNVGGTAKSLHDMRVALMSGPFMDFVRELSEYPVFNTAVRVSHFMAMRGEREELIIRFFALSDFLDRYRSNMSSFINRYIQENRDSFDATRLRFEFERTSIFVEKYLRDIFYSKKIRPNRVIFDSIFVGVNLALRERPNLVPKSTSWLFDPAYEDYIRVHAAQTSARVRDRIFYVKKRLLEGFKDA